MNGTHAKVTVTPAGLALIEAMAAEGNDQRTIAKALGIGRTTLTNIRDRDPEVTEAWESGHAALADELTHLLLSQARKGNIVAMIYLTKARLGWVEGSAPEEKRPNIIINLPDSKTPEDYMKMIAHHPVPQLPAPEEQPDVFGKVIR